VLNLEEFSDRIERLVSLSKEKVVSIGMRLREEPVNCLIGKR
jgi:hypothetical protein